jgi:hypothetical protein
VGLVDLAGSRRRHGLSVGARPHHGLGWIEPWRVSAVPDSARTEELNPATAAPSSLLVLVVILFLLMLPKEALAGCLDGDADWPAGSTGPAWEIWCARGFCHTYCGSNLEPWQWVVGGNGWSVCFS